MHSTDARQTRPTNQENRRSFFADYMTRLLVESVQEVWDGSGDLPHNDVRQGAAAVGRVG